MHGVLGEHLHPRDGDVGRGPRRGSGLPALRFGEVQRARIDVLLVRRVRRWAVRVRHDVRVLRCRKIQLCWSKLVHEVCCRVLRGGGKLVLVHSLSGWHIPRRCHGRLIEARCARGLHGVRGREVQRRDGGVGRKHLRKLREGNVPVRRRRLRRRSRASDPMQGVRRRLLLQCHRLGGVHRLPRRQVPPGCRRDRLSARRLGLLYYVRGRVLHRERRQRGVHCVPRWQVLGGHLVVRRP